MVTVISRARSRSLWLAWLLRYWVMDKYRNQLRLAVLSLALLALAANLAVFGASVYLLLSSPETHVTRAYAQWVVQLIILIISMLISYAMRPKVEEPKAQDAKVPVVEDGRSLVFYRGTGWIGDGNLAAWKKNGTEKIRSKGGKK